MRSVNARPAGYRHLGKVLQQSEKAMLFEYYGWELWIPKNAVAKIRGVGYAAPAWAIDSAKDWRADRCSK